MTLKPDDSGLLPSMSESDTNEYLEELGMKFKYGCNKGNDSIQCHSLGLWYESFKHNYIEAEDIFKKNCFTRRFPSSCSSYAFIKLFGAEGVRRDKQRAFEALKFGCRVAEDARCCQTAGELLLDDISTDNDNCDEAFEYFTRASKKGLPVSDYYLGGLWYKRASKRRDDDVRRSGSTLQIRSPEETKFRAAALRCWVAGCEGGHELACRNVARAYCNGDGVLADLDIANMYLERAETINKGAS